VRWTPPEIHIDPVCRMSVRTDGAKSSVYRGTIYYFCSAEHRDAFEADPER
jgi:YHS domain-containing protein